MSQTRISIIDQAFGKFDKTGDNVISVDDLRGVYSARQHPKFLSGEKTVDQVLREFLDVFDSGNKDGKVILILFFLKDFQNSFCPDSIPCFYNLDLNMKRKLKQ
jgi:Ca2+-binding EF-hand superfamily protein